MRLKYFTVPFLSLLCKSANAMVKFRLYFKAVSLKIYFVIMIMFNQMHLCYMNTITSFCFSFAPPFHLIFLFALFMYKGRKFVLMLIRCLCYVI